MSRNSWAPTLFVPVLLLRAADHARLTEVAAHYARQVPAVLILETLTLPALPAGTSSIAASYVDAGWICSTAPNRFAVRTRHRSLPMFLVGLVPSGRSAMRWWIIGRRMHRERDPTVPMTDAARDASAALAVGIPQFWYQVLEPPDAPGFVTGALALASFFAVGNALPGLAVAVVIRRLASQSVRCPVSTCGPRRTSFEQSGDPRTILLARRYQSR